MPTGGAILNQAIEAIYRLHVGVVGRDGERHERPHKPAMLLAVMDLIAAGVTKPDQITWSRELRSRFARYFEIVQRHDDQCTPENPFLYLRQEEWWTPFHSKRGTPTTLENTPTVADAIAGTVYAHLSDPVANCVITPSHRLSLRHALVDRYFPQARDRLNRLFDEPILAEVEPLRFPKTVEESKRPGRSTAFRRTILDIYDFQCAACGLRIRMPQIEDLTFVDAAHLIPFGDKELGGNDHPTNGIALCKNHHWAMDRFLIAPSPDHRWKVSPLVEARRSKGEAELQALQDQALLIPHEQAFSPDSFGLAWRTERLVA